MNFYNLKLSYCNLEGDLAFMSPALTTTQQLDNCDSVVIKSPLGVNFRQETIALKQGHKTSYNEMATDNTKMGHGPLHSAKREMTVFEIQTREGPGSTQSLAMPTCVNSHDLPPVSWDFEQLIICLLLIRLILLSSTARLSNFSLVRLIRTTLKPCLASWRAKHKLRQNFQCTKFTDVE